MKEGCYIFKFANFQIPLTVLIAPLNWGLGHASRCLPLIVRHLRAGDEVVLAGDGDSLTLLRKRFPGLRSYPLAPLNLRYGKGNSQVMAVLRMLPKLFVWSKGDHAALELILRQEHIDLIISDNRPGLYTDSCRTAYITHQLLIRMPRGLRWLEPLGRRLHARLIRRFTECWVPDFEGAEGLAGELSHTHPLPERTRFLGPLSRFEYVQEEPVVEHYDAVVVLSGLEPQRTILERTLLEEYRQSGERLLLIRGKVGEPPTAIRHGNITILPSISDGQLRTHLLRARTIISRSGYSSIMDYAALELLDKAKRGELTLRLIPTPGQPEQEYLAGLLAKR